MEKPALKRASGTLAVFFVTAQPGFAGRPLTVDDTDPVAHGQWEFEAGVAYSGDEDTTSYGMPLGLAYGLADNLEIGIGGGGQFENRVAEEKVSGLNDVTLAAKWRFFDAARRREEVESEGNLKLAVAGAVKLPTADEEDGLGSGSSDFSVLALLTREHGGLALDLNAGYTLAGGEDTPHILSYGLALRDLKGKLRPVGEIFVEQERGESAVLQISGGVQCDLPKGFMLDAAIGHGLGDNGSGLTATLGLTKTF